MNIQSLSIVVPAGCPNHCRFCVSKLHGDAHQNQMEKNRRFRDLYDRDFGDRMAFARDNGCNTLMFTGDGEPLMNLDFIERVANINSLLDHPFRWLELQTSGLTLDDEKLRWLRNKIKVSTISLSLSALENEANAEYNQTPEKLKVKIEELCAEIKRYDFNLRLSLNLTGWFDRFVEEHGWSKFCGGDLNPRPQSNAWVNQLSHPQWIEMVSPIFQRAKKFGADQITFRVLYESQDPTSPINKWIEENRASGFLVEALQKRVEQGRGLEKLPFGAYRYSVDGMSCVLDQDCMSTEGKEAIKYLILRPDSKLYTKWDDDGSILF